MTNASDSATFNIATHDSILLNQNGTIEISVVRGDQYEPASTTAEQVTIVAKETLPTVKINRTSPSSIDEGEDAVFTVTATGVTLTQELEVAVNIDEGAMDDFIDSATMTPSTVMVKTSGTGVLKIKTKADEVDEPNGTISVTLEKSSGATYLLGSRKFAMIAVKDNDDDGTLPKISIAGTTPVTEGDDVRFVLQANPVPSGDDTITARVQVSETGDFLVMPAKNSPRVVNVVIGASGGILSLPTVADAEDEPDAKVIGRIISEDIPDESTATYTIGTIPFFEITVQDNDDPTLHSINIAAVTASVSEAHGAKVQFNVTATGGSSGDTNPIAVDLSISQEGNFLQTAPGTRRNIMVTPGAQNVTGFPTIHEEIISNDNEDEPTGKIIAKVISKSHYAVGVSNVAEIVINDDEDAPEVSIVEVSENEGRSGMTNFDFAVQLSRPSASNIIINFAVGKEGDTATLNDDYQVETIGDSLTFPAHSTAPQYIYIDVIGDRLFEMEEKFTITLSLPDGTNLAELPMDPTWTGTIRNDDSKPTVSIADSFGDEGNVGVDGSVEFSVTLSEAAGVPVKVNYMTLDGTATTPGTSDDDYMPVSNGTITIPASNNSTSNLKGHFAITTKADDVAEIDETFNVELSLPVDANAVAGDKMIATGLIVSDDDPILNIVNTNPNGAVAEGGDATFEVTLAGQSPGIVTVLWSTADGSATKGEDYTAKSGTLVFTGNENKVLISVPTINDDFDERDQENFVIRLSGQNPPSIVYLNHEASVKINDNDAEPELSIGTVASITEGDSLSKTIRIPVMLNRESTREVTVDFAVTAGTAVLTYDYSVITSPARLTFLAQDQLEYIEIGIVGDIFYENNETFDVALSNAFNATIASAAATGVSLTINDNDLAPVFKISKTATINEGVAAGANSAKFVVTQTPGSGKAVSVDYTFDDVDAKEGAGKDYLASIVNATPADDGKTGRLTFPASDNPADSVAMNIVFSVVPDNLDEFDETFIVTLSNPTPSTDASIDSNNRNHIGTGTIIDDDDMPELTILDAEAQEGSEVVFTPTLSVESGRDVVVTYSTAPGGDFPVERDDYSAVPAPLQAKPTIMIPAGERTPNNPIRISTTADLTPEPDETFDLSFSANYAGVDGGTKATGKILNDDGQVLTITSTTVDEGAGMANLVITLSPAPKNTDTVVVSYATRDGTAISSSNGDNADFTAITPTNITFTKDNSSETIEISITDDDLNEVPELFTVVVETSASGVTTPVGNTGTVTINDNDSSQLELSIETLRDPINEGTDESTNTPLNIVVNLNRSAAREITVDYTLSSSNDGANIPLDVKLANNAPGRTSDSVGKLTFLRGERSKTIPLEIIADDYDESNETFKIELADAVGAELGTAMSVVIISDDDDEPKVSIVEAVTEFESDVNFDKTYTISLDHASGRLVTVPYTVTGTATSADYILADGIIEFIPAANTTITPTTKDLIYTIIGDDIGEITEFFTITLGDPTNGDITGVNSVSKITILDDEAPVLSIGNGAAITEAVGAMAEFPVTASFNSDKITVYYTPTQPAQAGDFLGGSLTSESTTSVELDFEGGTSAMLEVPIANDDHPEANNSITITLEDEQNRGGGQLVITYSVADVPNNSGTVAVTDDDSLPIISIVADNGETAENAGPAQFTLTAMGLSSNTMLMINATPAEDGGDFITDGVATETNFPVEFGVGSDGSYTGMLSVMLNDDEIGESTADIQVTLNPDPKPAKTYRIGATTIGTMTILDDDAPELSISAGTPVTERDNLQVMFTILAKVQPENATVAIDYTPESDDFLAAGVSGVKVENHSLTFEGDGPYTANLPISVDDDEKVEETGSIKVTLNQKAQNPSTGSIPGYTVASTPNNEASIKVYDDDELPVIMLVTDYEDVVERDEPIMFELIAMELTQPATLTINYTPAEDGGDFLNDALQGKTANHPVSFTKSNSGNTYAGHIPISLVADDKGEISANIQLTINPDPESQDSYKLGTTTTAKIKILDDDAPELSIKGGAPVFESNLARAEFIISTKVQPSGPIDVDYTPESSNYLLSTISGKKQTEKMVRFIGNGPYIATLFVEVDNDFTAEAKGEITVSLNQRNPIVGYTVASTPNNLASVEVFDDDQNSLPTISISATNSIYEGEDAVFDFTVSDLSADVSKVRVQVAESDYFLTNPALTPRIADIEITNGTGTLVEATESDSLLEDEGSITVKVLPDPEVNDTYTAFPEVVKTIRIIDNDATSPPSISIFASGNIVEGESENVLFTLVSTTGSDKSINSLDEVKIEITQVGNYLANGVETIMETIETLGSPKTISIGIEDDQFDEEDGEIIARILSDTHANQRWSVGSADRARVSVKDDDMEPEIRIESVEIDEGNYPDQKNKMIFDVKLMDSNGNEIKSGKNVSVNFATLARTAIPYDESENPEGDFLMLTGTLNFSPVTSESDSGESSKQIKVEIVGDTADEEDETLMVKLSGAVNARIPEGNDIAEGMIRNDDQFPFVSINLENESGQIVEGTTLNVLLKTGTNAPTAENSIRVLLSAQQTVGNYIAFRIPRSVVMTSNVARFNIYTIDDLIHEGNGTVKIFISGDGQRFNVDPQKSFIEVSVTDNDTPETKDVRIGIAHLVANKLLENSGAFSRESELSRAPVLKQSKISVLAVSEVVQEGEVAMFEIKGDENVKDGIVVDYILQPEGDFFESIGSEIKHVILSQTQLSSQVQINTINDSLAEQDGAISLTLIHRDLYELSEQSSARIIISDSADRQQRVNEITQASQHILSEITGSIGARTLDIATNRIKTAFSDTGGLSTFNYDGNQELTKILTAGGENLNDGTLTLRNLLGSSSFAVNLLSESESSSLATLWGIGDLRDLKSANNSSQRTWNGDVFTGHLGIDSKVVNGLLTGISASITESEIDHSGVTENEMTFKSRSTALNPYLGWESLTQDTIVNAIAGYGVGELDIDQANYQLESVSNSYYTLGISGNTRLYASESIIESGESELSISGQFWFARQHLSRVEELINSMQIDASHYRIGLEGSHNQNLASGSYMNQKLMIGLRGDIKDQQSIFGMEVSSKYSFDSPLGASLTADGSMFLIEQGEVQKWSVLGTLNFDQGKDQLGTIFEISPSYGQIHAEKTQSLWSKEILENVSESGQYIDGFQVTTNLGYGIGIFDHTSKLTPFGSVNFAEDSNNKYHLGTRVQLGTNLKFELTGTQEFNSEGSIDRKFQLDGAINW